MAGWAYASRICWHDGCEGGIFRQAWGGWVGGVDICRREVSGWGRKSARPGQGWCVLGRLNASGRLSAPLLAPYHCAEDDEGEGGWQLLEEDEAVKEPSRSRLRSGRRQRIQASAVTTTTTHNQVEEEEEQGQEGEEEEQEDEERVERSGRAVVGAARQRQRAGRVGPGRRGALRAGPGAGAHRAGGGGGRGRGG